MMGIDNFAKLGAFSEAYEIFKRVELVGHDRCRYRLDVFRTAGSQNEFSVRCYRDEDLTVQPTFPQTKGNFDRKLESHSIWVEETELPWVQEETGEAALDSGLRFLADLVKARAAGNQA